MSENGNKRINLLPGDIERRREIIKRAVAESAPEYTEPSSAPATEGKGVRKGSNGDLLRQPSVLKKGFLSGIAALFQGKKIENKKPVAAPPQKPKIQPQDLPVGTPAPSALFKDVPRKSAVPLPRGAATQKERKLGFFKRFFFKKVVVTENGATLAKPALGADFLKPASVKAETVSVVPKSPPKPVVKKPEPETRLEPPPLKKSEPKVEPTPEQVIRKPFVPVAADKPTPEAPSSASASVPKATEPLLGMNLLSAEYRAVFIPAHGKAVFLWTMAATAVVILFAYAFAYVYQIRTERAIASASESAKTIEQAVAEFRDLASEDKELAKKTAALGALFEEHISFSSFLKALESATVPEVTYTSIAVSRTGMVSIAAVAPSYTALARQLTVYEEDTPWIQKASMSSASLIRNELGAEDGVGFDVTLTVDVSIFEPEL